MKIRLLVAFLLLLGLFAACEQTNSPNVKDFASAKGSATFSDTSFVQLFPVWGGFNHPQAVIVGNEPFVYVTDTDNDRIVMMDVGGNIIGYSRKIVHPVAIAEDKKLNLLVCAQFDTLLAGHSMPTTFGALYRLDLVSQLHNIANVTPKRVLWERGDSTRRYTGVATLFDNSYYVSRIGPKNAPTNLDRDDAVILYAGNDSLISSVTNDFTADGTGMKTVHYLTAVATMPAGRSTEFLYSQVPSNAGIMPTFKVQWYRMTVEGQTSNWQSRYATGTGLDLMRDNRFTTPTGLAVDPSGNLFVADAGADSVYRFTSAGMEQFSIGKAKDGSRYFTQPYGVAYFDRTVYVADRGTGKVLRFKLSTDF
jgi:hypothetical protein